jgi:hypothetical protein
VARLAPQLGLWVAEPEGSGGWVGSYLPISATTARMSSSATAAQAKPGPSSLLDLRDGSRYPAAVGALFHSFLCSRLTA